MSQHTEKEFAHSNAGLHAWNQKPYGRKKHTVPTAHRPSSQDEHADVAQYAFLLDASARLPSLAGEPGGPRGQSHALIAKERSAPPGQNDPDALSLQT